MTETSPNPNDYQRASMLILLFRFRGSRKLVASRLMEGQDFWAELKLFLPILEKHYKGHEVSMVEIVSYQAGGFYYDPWRDGLEYTQLYQTENLASPEPKSDSTNEVPNRYSGVPEPI
ncbi:MAG: hypothetical protein MKZ59_02150 [Deinococcales bacterium]|nr:hypothetical protein [Deinococcales bacterium]